LNKTKLKQFAKDAVLAVPLRSMFVGVKSVVKLFGLPNKRFYWYLRFRGDFTVPIDDSRRFRLKNHGSSVENSIFWAGLTGEWEAASVKIWIKLADEADVIFDVGANNGVYALISKAVNPKAKVFAFEPIERIFEKLEENNRLNDYDIVCLKYGVSNKDGTAVMYDIPVEDSYSSSLNSEFASERGDEITPTEIKTLRLDTFIEQNDLPQVDLIKIDVETFEPEVLEGLGEYVEKFKPTMLIEVLTDDVARRIEKLVGGKDYLYFDINEETGLLEKVERLTKSSSFNFLLCTEDVARRIDIHK
jgi:FkbM family methyltransferase